MSTSSALPAEVAAIAFHNKAVVYDLLFRAASETMLTIAADEFVRRFLLHVLPRGFHRIRHYGLLASSSRKDSLALARNPSHIRSLRCIYRLPESRHHADSTKHATDFARS